MGAGEPFGEGAQRNMAAYADGSTATRFHELRHSCAGILLEQGYSLRGIQGQLRHADIRMTSRYSHLDISRKKKSAELMAKSFPERC